MQRARRPICAAARRADRGRDRRAALPARSRGGARGCRGDRRSSRDRVGRRAAHPRAQPRAPRKGRADRRPVVPDRRGRARCRTARARRRRDLPRAHAGHGRGGRARRASPLRLRPRGRRRRDAPTPGPCDGLTRAMTRAGFVALAGRPNAGKSTLMNQIVGAKVAITSPRPQTTRRAIRGVATAADWQLVVVDLPGVQRPRDPLTERMQRRMEAEMRDSDAALFVLNGHEKIGAGDRFIAEAIKKSGLPTVTVVNKLDLIGRAQIVQRLDEAAALEVQGEIFPVSAKKGTGVAEVVKALAELMPEGPLLYPPEEKTDLALEVRLAEIVREQILHRTHDEIPHAVEVQVDEVEERADGLMRVTAHAWAETESQKGILVGKGGQMVRAVGTSARKEMEALLGRKVFLDLSVRVRRGWRQDESLLDRLGIE